MRIDLVAMALATVLVHAAPASAQAADLREAIQGVMRETGARGIAVAVVEDGRVVDVQAHGDRNAAGEPLTPDTIMYAASLTKAAFGYMVMQLVDEGVIDLDRSIADYLPRPLTDYGSDAIEDRYARYSDLAGDARWRMLTPRILLTHRSGFANFGFLEPDGKLKFHFDPGSRYGYSGEGIILLQFVLEQGLGLDVGAEMQRRVFDRFGMMRTSMMWRPDFAGNLADGWTLEGEVVPHDERSRVRAAGSMDTTIADMARLAAGIARGDGLSPAAQAERVRAQAPITIRSQFPTLQPELPVAEQHPGLAAGLGVIRFEGPQGQASTRAGTTTSSATPGSASSAVAAVSSSFPMTFAPSLASPGSSGLFWARQAFPGIGNTVRCGCCPRVRFRATSQGPLLAQGAETRAAISCRSSQVMWRDIVDGAAPPPDTE